MYKIYKHFNIDDIPDDLTKQFLYNIYAIYTNSRYWGAIKFWCDSNVKNPYLIKLTKYLINQGAEEGELVYIDF